MMHRVMPWLWRLADEDCQQQFAVPPELREELIAALARSPHADGPQVGSPSILVFKCSI